MTSRTARIGSSPTARVTLAALVATLGGFVTLLAWSGPNRTVVSVLLAYVAGATTYLVMGATVVFSATAAVLSRHAAATDAGRGTVLSFVVGASAVVVAGAVTLLRGVGTSDATRELLLGLTFGATVLAWLVTNVAFALHYAHLHYAHLHYTQRQHEPGDRDMHSPPALEASATSGGFLFPGGGHPDGLDFAYLAFTVGMTFQVSDVQVVARRCRRAVLGHGLLAFAYYTLLVAMVINVALSQLQRGGH